MKDRRKKRIISYAPIYKELPDRDSVIGFSRPVTPDRTVKRRVLITGAGSYIGESFCRYTGEHYSGNFETDTIDMIDGSWRDADFGGYDVVFHVAGIAHKRVNEKDERARKTYYAVNTELAIKVAEKAKVAGVQHFVFMSSMSIYGDSAPYGKNKVITADTKPKAKSVYGDSKWQADKKIRALADKDYRVSVLRPPMVYGNGCKGNYPILAKLAQKLPVFPEINNEKSILYVDNLCEFLCQFMLVPIREFSEAGNIFFPQDLEYVRTSKMVRQISQAHGKRIWVTRLLDPFVWIGSKIPGDIGKLVNKAFGNISYSREISLYEGIEYQIERMNRGVKKAEAICTDSNKKRVLILANHGLYVYKLRIELIKQLLSEGYEVHISSPSSEEIAMLIELGCRYHELNINRHGMNPKEELKILTTYKKLIVEVKPDMVLAYTIKPNIYGGMACSCLKIPYIANVTGLGTAVEQGGLMQRFTLALYKAGLKKAQKVFFQNRENMDFMLGHGVVKGPYSLLPGSGVNLAQHCLEPYPEDKVRLVFTTVGRIMKDKGTGELLQAAETIKKKYPKVKFRLVGFFDDDYEDVIREAVKAGIVEYTGQQKDIHPFIAECHAIIHPSYHEGMSNVLLEAAATGRPVLASDIPGCRETFDEGTSGLGFAPRDTDSLVQTIEKFIKLPYEKKVQMGQAGRRKMEAEFDRRIIVEAYMEEIRKLENEK